jgi:hypothetical protein
MLETYLDESDNSIHKVFAVGALVVHQESRPIIWSELDEICRSVARQTGKAPGEPLELHGVNVYGGGKDWKGIPRRLRFYAYKKTFETITKHAIRFIVKPINYQEIWRDPHHLAMLWALERVQDIAARRSTESLLFADRKPEAEQGLRQAFDSARITGTRGWRPTRLTRIKEEVSFEESSLNRLIQACDMALFIHHRRVFDQAEYEANPEKITPERAKSIAATKELARILEPIKSSLSPWP